MYVKLSKGSDDICIASFPTGGEAKTCRQAPKKRKEKGEKGEKGEAKASKVAIREESRWTNKFMVIWD